MKVLYLVPQPKRADRIGAYSFLDEEIQALASAGIEAYVLSRKIDADAICGRVVLAPSIHTTRPTARAASIATRVQHR